MSKLTITTSPELIRLLGEKLYDNRLDAILVRELLQNAVDAGKKGSPIDIYTNYHGSEFEIIVEDRGCGMSEDTLVNVFLNIGGSYKPNNEDSTGGFGIAKVALFNAYSWDVFTLDHKVNQDLELSKISRRVGTKVSARVRFDSSSTWDMRKALRMLYTCDIPNVVHNGEEVVPFKPTGRINRYTTEDGIDFTVRFANGFRTPGMGYDTCGYVIYRINGLTQCIEYGGDDLDRAQKNIVVDFGKIGYRPTDKGYPFSMSRENPTYDVRKVINETVRELAKDTLSTIANQGRGEIKRWENPNTGLVSYSDDGRIYRPDLTDRRIAKLWGALIEVMVPNKPWTFAVTNEVDTMAFLKGKDELGINPYKWVLSTQDLIDREDSGAFVMAMWHLACHELAHLRYGYHDEDFASEEGRVSRSTIANVFNHMNDLRVLARRVWGK